MDQVIINVINRGNIKVPMIIDLGGKKSQGRTPSKSSGYGNMNLFLMIMMDKISTDY